MSIPEFNVKEQWIGTGDTAGYDFDFTIQDLLHLLIYVQDDTGAVVSGYPIRGDDDVLLADVVFDAALGGGTITLAEDLPTDYTLTALMANDQPSQLSEFKNKGSFTLNDIELALDFLACQIQRLSYLAQRSVKLADIDDADDIVSTLPSGVADNIGATLVVNEDGDGFDFGATLTEIAEASENATEAAASQAAAAISETNALASAVAAAASAIAAQSGFHVLGTRALPTGITAAGGLTDIGQPRQLKFIHGSPGAVVISANPQVSVSASLGAEMTLVGCDDVNTVTLTNGNGLDLNGDCILGNGDTLGLVWDGTNWSEVYRRSAT